MSLLGGDGTKKRSVGLPGVLPVGFSLRFAVPYPNSGLMSVAGSGPKFCRITIDWSEKNVR